MTFEGILPVNKPIGKTSFSLIGALRRHTDLYTIGHAGTLDPFASGVMILLLGRPFTKQSNTYLEEEKEYRGTITLGVETDTYDSTGKILTSSPLIPTLQEIETVIQKFQGTIEQIPPMFSAKKIGGKKLYELARKGREIERKPASITLKTTLLHYTYPFLDIHVTCTKGTYVRSLAYDIGKLLTCGAHLSTLTRLRCGSITLADCLDGDLLFSPILDKTKLQHKLRR